MPDKLAELYNDKSLSYFQLQFKVAELFGVDRQFIIDATINNAYTSVEINTKPNLIMFKLFGMELYQEYKDAYRKIWQKNPWCEPYKTPRERVLEFQKEIRSRNSLIKTLNTYFIKGDIKHTWVANQQESFMKEVYHDSFFTPDEARDVYAKRLMIEYKEVELLKKSIDRIKKPIIINEKNSYDIERIKEYPMDQITRILPNGFFVANPFRTENSPSNSLHWDKRCNRFMDFADGRSGDVVDVYQAIYKCTFIEALKELSNL